MNLIRYKTKKLSRFQSGCHGNLITNNLVTRDMTDAFIFGCQPSYQGNKVRGWCLVFQRTSVPIMDLIWVKTEELLTYHFSCHGNLVTIATRYVVDAYCPVEPPCKIWTQYTLRQRSYKVKYIWLRLIDSRLINLLDS